MLAQRDHRGHPFEIDGPADDEPLEEWPAERIARDALELERAKATVLPDGGDEWNPEPVDLREGEQRDDDNKHDLRNQQQMAMADDTDLEESEPDERPPIHVGDHVRDRDDEDGATMLVVGLPVAAADEYTAGGKTIAEYNPEYPADDEVIEVVYPQRTDVDVKGLREYAFPRSRLTLEAPIHDLEAEAEVSA
ncbi:MAG: hypothetical protein ACOC06_06255 [Halorubrum sp.]